MAFRRKRKAQVLWTPSFNGTNLGVVQQATAAQGHLNVPRVGGLVNGNTFTTIHALTDDVAPDATGERSMAAYQGSGYRLRRVVGKLFCAMRQFTSPDTSDTPAALVGAGLIILRVDDSGGPLIATTPNHYSPLLTPNERDPWIWRRTWLLTNGIAKQTAAFTANEGYAFIDGPFNNYELAASSVDSAHIDQKTARRVGPEERIFLVVSTQNPVDFTFSNEGVVDFIFDYRMIISPARTYGNRRNASR